MQENAEEATMTMSEFIESCYSGLKAKFDLSTDEDKKAIVDKLNKVQPGLGTALSKEREDLETIIKSANNPQQIVDVLLPMTQLQGIKLAVNMDKSEEEKKEESRSRKKHRSKEMSINIVQPMFVLQSKNEALNESAI